jgi:TolB-like protein/class 3 adenylate cyclase/Tfp pilus assembly protein PilF
VQPVTGERRMAAILAADVVGYSRLMGADEAGTLARLKAHRRELIDPTVAACHGRIVKLMGDGELVEFASVVDALRCAATVQRGMVERNNDVSLAQRIELRIGINLGDVIVDGDDLYGDGVNIAARLEALAEPGGICISGAVLDQVLHKLDLGFHDLGELRLKNIADPVRVYRVLLEPAAAGRIVRAAPPWRRRLIAAAVVLVLLVAGGVGALRIWPRPATTPSVVVLPFDNLSNDPDQEYFADGITEDLITDLARISGLVVIARNSAFAYKGRPVDPAAVARELGVRYLVEGSVRRVGERVRINAQLIDSETGGHLWAERFDRDAVDLFAVQDEVLRHIVDALAVRLSGTEQQRLTRLPTTNLEAYDFYLRAEQAARTGFTPKLREALRLYEEAIVLDPAFAEAYAADARTAAEVMRNDYNDVLPIPLARKRAYEHASRALELAPDAPLPFAVLAVLQAVDGRHDEALTSAERAVALGPSDAEAHAALSFVLTFGGRHAEAVAAVETALRLNPSLATGDRLVAGLAFLLDNQPGRAIEILERARAEAPDVDTVHMLLTAAYARAGRTDEARRAAAEAVRLGPLNSVGLYGVVYEGLRNKKDLAQLLDDLRAGGMPEWGHGFHASGYERLGGAEIHRLAFGRTWQGRVEGGGPAIEQVQPDGKLAFRTTTYIATGAAFVDGDMLCERLESMTLGRPVCGPVYRRTERSAADDLPYVYVNGTKVFRFAPVE